MKIRFKKIDAVIIVAIIIIAGAVLYKVGYLPSAPKSKNPVINFEKDDKNNKLIVTYVSTVVKWSDINIEGIHNESSLSTYVVKDDEITDCSGEINIYYKPTSSLIYSCTFVTKVVPPTNFPYDPTVPRGVTPKDEGAHFDDILSTVSREWWYYTVVFDKNSELAGWTVSISFNHMAYTDLLGSKPDMMVVTIHGPNGEEFGGVVNKLRGGGLIWDPTLKVKSSDTEVIIEYEDSWVQGMYPKWVIHIEDKNNEIDENNDITMDLTFTAPSLAIWTYDTRLFDEGKSKIASYMFAGCSVEGTVTINGNTRNIKGTGYYEHSWSTSLLKPIIKGWDWCHITLDNGWNIYYSNYYLTSQLTTSKTYKINPLSAVIITTDKGETITSLDDVEITIDESDKAGLLLKTPTEISIKAKPKITRVLLSTYDIFLELNIKFEKSIEKKFGVIDVIDMNIGRSTVSGKITWSDENGDHDVALNGIGSMWTMRH